MTGPPADGPRLPDHIGAGSEPRDSLRLLRKNSFQGFAHRIRLEPKGSCGAFEGDVSVAVDDVEPVGPARISHLGGIAELVDESREFDTQLRHAEPCKVYALIVALGTGENDFVLLIGLELPEVAGVRLLDIDREKLGAVLVLFVELVERGNLPAKWRSSVAPENEHDGF